MTQLLPGALVGNRGHSILPQSSSPLHHPRLGQLKQAPSLSIPPPVYTRSPLVILWLAVLLSPISLLSWLSLPL